MNSNSFLQIEIPEDNKCPKCGAQLTRRHCLTCEYSIPIKTIPKPHKKLEPRANFAFVKIIGHYGISLPKNAIEWRLCRNSDNEIGIVGNHSIHGLVTHLITDGIVSWFLLGDHETLFFGHASNFEPSVEEKPKAKGPRKLSQALLNLADED